MKHENIGQAGLSREAGQTNSQRQAAFKTRQRADGKRMVTIWIHEPTRQAGFEQGIGGKPGLPISEDMDAYSWMYGWIDGDAQRRKEER
jgi:hypothetical protein